MVDRKTILEAAWNVWEESNGNNWNYVRVSPDKPDHNIIVMAVKYDVSSTKVDLVKTSGDVEVWKVGEPFVSFEVQVETEQEAANIKDDVYAVVKKFFSMPPIGIAKDDQYNSLHRNTMAVMPIQIYSKAYFAPLVTVDKETGDIISAGGYTRKDFDAMFSELLYKFS